MSARRSMACGFTLIEVLIALTVMAIMAALTWQGVDGMSRASQQHRQRSDAVATVNTALSQWRADLDQLIDASSNPAPPAAAGAANAQTSTVIQAVDFDSRVLRLTRRFSGDEMRVVAWGARLVTTDQGSQKQFLRWLSEPVRTRDQWQAAWDQAARWGQNPTQAERDKETPLFGIEEWQVFYYRNDAWTNPLSSVGQDANTTTTSPEGVRLVVKLSAQQLPGGQLSLDWVQPVRGGGKS